MSLGLHSNPLLQAILENVFEQRAAFLAEQGAEVWGDEQESRVFPLPLARSEIEKLRAANRSSKRYDLQDFHALLVYGALHSWVEIWNDLVECEGSVELGRFRLGAVDFDYVCDALFWDQDFLLPADLVNAIRHRSETGLTDDTWSIANQLVAHPDELALRERPDECTWEDRIAHYKPGGDYPSECFADGVGNCAPECYWSGRN